MVVKNRASKVGAAALIALAAVATGGILPAAAQQPAAHTLTPSTVMDTRNMRYCEILIVKETGVEVYNTTGLNDCPAEVWDKLDLEKIKQQFGAKAVQKNGPHFWMMDSQTIGMGEKASLAALEAHWVATLPLAMLKGEKTGTKPYTPFAPKKTQKMVYAKGKPVYEVVDPKGNAYVLQAHEKQFTPESLAALGDTMKQLPKGWKFRTRTLTENLVLDLTPDVKVAYGLGDEFHQYYTLISPVTKGK
jgi:hypothetical protein